MYMQHKTDYIKIRHSINWKFKLRNVFIDFAAVVAYPSAELSLPLHVCAASACVRVYVYMCLCLYVSVFIWVCQFSIAFTFTHKLYNTMLYRCFCYFWLHLVAVARSALVWFTPHYRWCVCFPFLFLYLFMYAILCESRVSTRDKT